MTKIICAKTECKYNKKCQCSAKEINLTAHSIVTLYNDRQDFNICLTFEESEESKELRKKFMKFLSKGEQNEQN